MALKVCSAVKQLMYVLKIKLFRVVADSIHSFRIRSKETLRIMYFKNPPLLWIIWINTPFLDFCKELRNIRFRIKNPDLDFSKETHPLCRC